MCWYCPLPYCRYTSLSVFLGTVIWVSWGPSQFILCKCDRIFLLSMCTLPDDATLAECHHPVRRHFPLSLHEFRGWPVFCSWYSRQGFGWWHNQFLSGIGPVILHELLSSYKCTNLVIDNTLSWWWQRRLSRRHGSHPHPAPAAPAAVQTIVLIFICNA